MPSLAMYLAIAKKYIEQHPEENEEEFIEGIIAPDRKRNIRDERHKLHFGNSHNPDLNRYYQEQGLNSSFNRGYFLNLLTDYLFYNKFLTEYSADIFYDYKRMNKRIEERYGIEVPEKLKNRVKYQDGELKAVNEEEVYKFIDTVSQLDLERYNEQIAKKDEEHKLEFVGMIEGLLCKHKEKNIFNSYDEMYFYGFENNYGVLIQRVIGWSETEGAKEGLYQVTPVGIAIKPSKIFELTEPYIATIREELTEKEEQEILQLCEKNIDKKLEVDLDFNLEKVNRDDIKSILKTIRNLPERKTKKEISKEKLNIDMIDTDDFEIE